MRKNKTLIIFALFVVIGIIGAIIMENPTIKYGTTAVNDGKKVLFTVDRYLDGIITKDEMKNQIKLYDKYNTLSFDGKGRNVYFDITYINLSITDADLYERRNKLASTLHEKKK